MKVAVLASGGGSNLQALIDSASSGSPFEVVLVCSNKADSGALARARDAGIRGWAISDPSDGQAMVAELEESGAQFVVLAGYLKLVPAAVIARFEGSIINIHPALLPAFGGKGMFGLNVHRAVLQSGATVSGPSVHLVSANYDEGTVLAQWPVPVLPDDTPESLQFRVLEVEHRLLPAAVTAASQNGNKAIRLPFSLPCFDSSGNHSGLPISLIQSD